MNSTLSSAHNDKLDTYALYDTKTDHTFTEWIAFLSSSPTVAYPPHHRFCSLSASCQHWTFSHSCSFVLSFPHSCPHVFPSHPPRLFSSALSSPVFLACRSILAHYHAPSPISSLLSDRQSLPPRRHAVVPAGQPAGFGTRPDETYAGLGLRGRAGRAGGLALDWRPSCDAECWPGSVCRCWVQCRVARPGIQPPGHEPRRVSPPSAVPQPPIW